VTGTGESMPNPFRLLVMDDRVVGQNGDGDDENDDQDNDADRERAQLWPITPLPRFEILAA
jgi:hypothetical protein